MAERFEDRHRELRAQAAGRMAGPSAIPLVRFNRATSGLVDDLVAAVRDAVDAEGDDPSPWTARLAAALAALDEASDRG